MTGNDPRNNPDGGPQDDTSRQNTASQSGAATGQQIEIGSDEEWKSRVKAEDAALDQKFHAEPQPVAEPQAGESTQRSTEGSTEGRPAHGAAPEAARAQRGSAARPEQSAVPQFPEASLAGLIGLLSTQAMVALGLVPNPATKKAERELPVARYFIDLIAVLEKKTTGNLDPDEAAALDESLHTLRMAFVQRSKETA